ncbi:MAG: asparagine synthase (glutamine-hydrolyzing) [Gemmatimonadaceae bacterium]
MCGIGGIVSTGGTAVSEGALDMLSAAVEHRGPDDSGVMIRQGERCSVGLVHRRLAILDPSAAAHQPIGSAERGVWLTYNGEIYNYRAVAAKLEAKGHHIHSTGDTEVLLHAYEEWGAECLAELNGMFAFAVWDERRQELFAARDRLGIKPLHYYWDGRVLAFSSELRGLAEMLRDRLTLDPTALTFYGTLGYIPAPYTAYCEIRKLEPGHWLRLRGSTLTTRQYWDVDFARKERRPIATLMREIPQRLGASVAAQMVSDVPLGAFLSGGIDSGAVVALMARASERPVNTFSIGFREREFDETPRAQLVARRYGTEHREFRPTARAVDIAPTLVRHFGEPFADSSAIPSYYLSEMTRQYVKVALSGDGGDELFCGYTINLGHQISEVYRLLPARVRRGIEAAVLRLRWSGGGRADRVVLAMGKRLRDASLPPAERVRSKNTTFPDSFRAALADAGTSADLAPVEALFDSLLRKGDARSFLDRIAYLQLKMSLPDDMLTKVDRTSMAHSLEVRVPFLDHEFVEYVATIPAETRFRYWQSKWLLRAALRPYLPAEILRGRKRGFNAPLAYWLSGSDVEGVRDVRDPNARWGRMIYDEWRKQDKVLACGS